MTSYQVMCSVLRPPDPTSQCQIREFQDKAEQHMDSVFQDLKLTPGSSGVGGGQQQQNQGDIGNSGSGAGPAGCVQSADDNLMLCAVVSKTSASFSGSDSFKSRVRLPFFWCNWCPFDTESKASLLQHLVSQHCFICRFCPYVAMSRFDVINHGLKQHAQFSQFSDQRLRACHLKRDLFQLHFDPRSESQQDRKRAAPMDNHPDEGPSSPKHRREDVMDSISNTEDEERMQDQESSSESVDDLPLQFPQVDLPENSSSLPSMSQQGSNITTHVMENVVSSSGMELDIGSDQNLTSRRGQLETSLSPVPSTSLSLEDKGARERLHISVVKQEGESDDAEFAHALGKTPPEGPSQSGDLWKGDKHAAHNGDGTSVCVKQEPVERSSPMLAHMDSLYQHDDLQGHVLSRSVDSPPLSNIRVENLQRQFEESFGVHPVALSSSVVSDFQQTEPRPLHLITQPSRLTSQGLVENFLIDPSKSTPSFPEHESRSNVEWSNDRSSPSMLRHLLTRPLHKSSEQSSVNGSEMTHPEQEDNQPNESKRQAGQLQGKSTDGASVTQVLDNFLLTSDKQQMVQNSKTMQRRGSTEFKDSESANTDNQIFCHSDTRSSEDAPSFIKQEPEDSSEDYSTALSLMASSASRLKLTSTQSGLPLSELQDVPSMLYSRRSSPQDMLQTSAAHQESSRESHSSEKVLGQILSAQAIPSAESLKTYSNMSLRDLLTMDTRGSLCSVKGQATDNTRSYDCADTVENSVVWECGFCHFEDHNKAVVLAHRQQHHAQQMEEAGMRDSPRKDMQESQAVSSMDEEEKLSHGDADEGQDHVSWMDQPSTSSGYRSISQVFSSFPPSALSEPGGLMYRRAQRMRGFRRDDDFDYLSDSTVESESDMEPDNLEDKTYEPPKNLGFSDTNPSSEEEGSDKGVKNKNVLGYKLRKRKHLSKKKNIRKDPHLRKDTSMTSGSDIIKDSILDVPEKEQEHTELYRCISCRRQPLTLPAIKDHIRSAPDHRHLLMVRPVRESACMLFICPGTKCGDTNTAIFTECQSYLVHVLQCQGHIFDVLKSAVHTMALAFSNKRKDNAGIIDCPIDNCHFVSYNKGQLWAHVDDHLNHLHASQMLLFRSVCTVMAKMYGRVDGFDRYICYRCSSILIDLPRVVQHMMSDHRGQVRGVLIVTQKTEHRSQGIVVAIQCLKCSMRVLSLHHWFTHKCQLSLQILVEDRTQSQPSTDSAHSSDKGKAYNPEPSIPPFEEWIWGQQSSSIKTSTSATATNSALTEMASRDQLPIIRSILLSHPPSKRREAGRDQKVGPQVKDRTVVEEEEEEEITAMVQCKVCQQFVAENNFSQHGCNVDSQTVTVKREKDSVVQGVLSSNASSSKQQQPYLPGDANISHSKLLAALATRHHNNPTDPLTRQNFSPPGSAPKSQPTSTSHPSLISLLTQTDMAALKQSTSQLGQGALASSQLTQKTNPLKDHLTKLQMMHSSSPAPEHDKSQNSEEPPPADKSVRSILSQVLRQKSKDTQQKFQAPFFSSMQEGGDHVKAAGEQSSSAADVPATVPTQPMKEGHREQQQPSSAAVVMPNAELNIQTGRREGESQQVSNNSSHPPLMTFLSQQGDQVRQVLGNILDDQEESLQS